MSDWNQPHEPYRSGDSWGGTGWRPPTNAQPGGDPYAGGPQGAPYGYSNGDRRSRLTAGLLGIFLGGLGIHSFYLGDTRKGVIQIVVTIFTCGLGALWGFIEGIMILAGSVNTDARGARLDK